MGKLKRTNPRQKTMVIYLDCEGIKDNVTAEGYEGMIALKYFKTPVSNTR